MNFKTFIAGFKRGGISSFTSNIFTQPFQVISTNMKISYEKGDPISMITAIKLIYQKDGLLGFYRGFGPAAIKTTFGTSVYFAMLEITKKFFKKKTNINNEFLIHFLSSGFSRGIQMITVAPISVIKTRFEVAGFNSYNNIIDALIKIKKDEGYSGYFKGLSTTLIKEMPNSGSYYACFELSKKTLAQVGIQNTQMKAFMSGLIASGIMTLVFNPLEVMKTRIQYYFFSKNLNHNYKSVAHGVFTIAKKEGFKGLSAGLLPIIIKKGLNSTIVWTLYDTLKKKN